MEVENKSCLLCHRDMKKGGFCIPCRNIIRRKQEVEILYEERILLAKIRREKAMAERWADSFSQY